MTPADAEIGRGLAGTLRFRYAVQADYFAGRVARDYLTGIADAYGNEEGLEHARRHLAVR
jgi:hypothetical protein